MSSPTLEAQSQLDKLLPPLSEFSLFPFLPAELRLMIWEYAVEHKRLVRLHPPPEDTILVISRLVLGYTEQVGEGVSRRNRGLIDMHAVRHRVWQIQQGVGVGVNSEEGWHSMKVGWMTSTPAPGMLTACWESREVALSKYRLAFGWFRLKPRIWINFDQDDVVLVSKDFAGMAKNHQNADRYWKLSMQLAWLTTPDVARIQRVISHDTESGDMWRVRHMPQHIPWRRTWLNRHNTTLLPKLKSWVHVNLYQRERQPEKKIVPKDNSLLGRLRRAYRIICIEIMKWLGLNLLPPPPPPLLLPLPPPPQPRVYHKDGARCIKQQPWYQDIDTNGGWDDPSRPQQQSLASIELFRYDGAIDETYLRNMMNSWTCELGERSVKVQLVAKNLAPHAEPLMRANLSFAELKS